MRLPRRPSRSDQLRHHQVAASSFPDRRPATCPEPDLAAYRDFPSRWPPSAAAAGKTSIPFWSSKSFPPTTGTRTSFATSSCISQSPTIREYWIIDPVTDPDRPTLRVHRKRGARPGSGPSKCPSAGPTPRACCRDSPWSWTPPPDRPPARDSLMPPVSLSSFARGLSPEIAFEVLAVARRLKAAGQGRHRTANRRQSFSDHAPRRRGRNPGHPGRRHALLPLAGPALLS